MVWTQYWKNHQLASTRLIWSTLQRVPQIANKNNSPKTSSLATGKNMIRTSPTTASISRSTLHKGMQSFNRILKLSLTKATKGYNIGRWSSTQSWVSMRLQWSMHWASLASNQSLLTNTMSAWDKALAAGEMISIQSARMHRTKKDFSKKMHDSHRNYWPWAHHRRIWQGLRVVSFLRKISILGKDSRKR